ncbi:MAG: hypothetical protein ACREE2_11145 [Stellaceae bacterium]
MSIRDEISARANESPPRLFFLSPLIASAGIVREMFVSEEINLVVHPPWPNTPVDRRLAQMRAYLDAWTEGRRLTVANDAYKKLKATNWPGRTQSKLRCLTFAASIRNRASACLAVSQISTYLSRSPGISARIYQTTDLGETKSNVARQPGVGSSTRILHFAGQTSMHTSPTSSLSKPSGAEPIPLWELAYFQARNRSRVHDLVLDQFQKSGINQADLARRMNKRPEVISRLLGAPGNWGLDTISDLLFAISGAEPVWEVDYPLDQAPRNYRVLEWLSATTSGALAVNGPWFDASGQLPANFGWSETSTASTDLGDSAFRKAE